MPRVDPNYKFSDLSKSSSKPNIRVVMVGDANAGKTSAIENYMHNTFDINKGPSKAVLDAEKLEKSVNDIMFGIEMQDTSGQRDEAQTSRRQQYKDSDVFMLCLAVNSEDDSDEGVQFWINEIRSVEPRKPIVLMLTKDDLLNGDKVVFTKEILN